MDLINKIILISDDRGYVQGQVYVEDIERVKDKELLLTDDAMNNHQIFNRDHQKKFIFNKGITYKLVLSNPIRYYHQLQYPPSRQRNVIYLNISDISMPIHGNFRAPPIDVQPPPTYDQPWFYNKMQQQLAGNAKNVKSLPITEIIKEIEFFGHNNILFDYQCLIYSVLIHFYDEKDDLS